MLLCHLPSVGLLPQLHFSLFTGKKGMERFHDQTLKEHTKLSGSTQNNALSVYLGDPSPSWEALSCR